MWFPEIDQATIIALIGVLGGVLPYVLTKNKEINATTRQEKTKRYDNLIDSLAMILSVIARKDVDDKVVIETVRIFVTAYNRASTYASDLVLERCNDLANGITEAKDGGEQSQEKIRILIGSIYKAIRKDLNPKADYFTVGTFWPNEGPFPEEGKSRGAPIK